MEHESDIKVAFGDAGSLTKMYEGKSIAEHIYKYFEKEEISFISVSKKRMVDPNIVYSTIDRSFLIRKSPVDLRPLGERRFMTIEKIYKDRENVFEPYDDEGKEFLLHIDPSKMYFVGADLKEDIEKRLEEIEKNYDRLVKIHLIYGRKTQISIV